MISDNKSVMGFNLIWLWEKDEKMALILENLLSMNLAKPVVGRCYNFLYAK